MSDGLRDAFGCYVTSGKLDPKVFTQIDLDNLDDLFSDFLDEDTVEIDRRPFNWLNPVCECGSAKTYGKECGTSMHSEWCPVKA